MRAAKQASPAITTLGLLAAVVITTAMDVQGLSDFSALPLCPLMFALWYLTGLSRREMGFAWGAPRHHALALIHPLAVIGAATAIAIAAGAVNFEETDWARALANFGLIAVSTFLVAIVTEEGFFRGWLWGALARSMRSDESVLILSSLAFALWHASAVLLPTGFDIPRAQVPVFLANATLLGATWGVLRWRSGSLIVASVSHGLWNGLAYSLFGFGAQSGALGVSDTALFGPEVGLFGLGLNAAFLAALWFSTRPRSSIG
ncbi:MAG: lysostaphin resistance A-like protein [Sphingomonas sp.]